MTIKREKIMGAEELVQTLRQRNGNRWSLSRKSATRLVAFNYGLRSTFKKEHRGNLYNWLSEKLSIEERDTLDNLLYCAERDAVEKALEDRK